MAISSVILSICPPHKSDRTFTQQTTEAIACRRVGWANNESLAISSVILSICPPHKSDRTFTQQTTEAIACRRVGWANNESLAISSVILSICPPYNIRAIALHIVYYAIALQKTCSHQNCQKFGNRVYLPVRLLWVIEMLSQRAPLADVEKAT
ncbi:MAG: hypothetical protein F6K64_06205 [Moorea sp. SIO3A2]|nr:hypothetical protein [Moorena sp. SIO3A2]